MLLSNYYHFLSLSLLLGFFNGVFLSETSLRLVHVIYRHGDRSPTFTYPTDPHQEDAWPQGFGQLTTIGMAQAYKLGQFLRKRYSGFLSSTYVRSQIHVRSSDKDRTLMTASSVLWGLFPAAGSQKWKRDSTWQPIPVHTVSQDQDLLIYAHCPSYDELLEQLMSSPGVKEIEHKNKALIDYIAKHSGMKPELLSLLKITNPLFCEKVHNMDFPDWLKKDNTYEKIMKFWDVNTLLKVNTTSLMKLKVGVLLGEMQQHIENWIKHQNITEKMFMYSAHDTNVAAILNGLKVYDGHHPSYCSCVMIELHEMSDKSFGIQLYYQKQVNEKPHLLKIPGCSSSMCSVAEFAAAVKYLIPINPKAACYNRPGPDGDVSDTDTTIIAAVFFTLALLMVMVTLVMLICHFRQRNATHQYRALKSEL